MNEDRANVRRARRSAKSQRKDELDLIARILAEPVGRRWFYNQLATCHVYSTSFDKVAMQMAFYEGERNVGLRMVADLTAASPELYLLMLKEVEDERRSNDIADADDARDSAGFTDAGADADGSVE